MLGLYIVINVKQRAPFGRVQCIPRKIKIVLLLKKNRPLANGKVASVGILLGLPQ